MSGELICQIPAAAWVACKGLTQRHFRHTAVIGLRRVIVVDTCRHGGIHHAVQRLLIDGIPVCQQRQPHGTETERRQRKFLKLFEYHIFCHFFLFFIIISATRAAVKRPAH